MSRLDLFTTAVDDADDELRRKYGMQSWLAQAIDLTQISLGVILVSVTEFQGFGILWHVLALALILAALGTTIGRWR